MLDSMGLSTGIDLERLLAVREIAASYLGSDSLSGALARAGLTLNLVPHHQQHAGPGNGHQQQRHRQLPPNAMADAALGQQAREAR
jgi:hypothetical protein